VSSATGLPAGAGEELLPTGCRQGAVAFLLMQHSERSQQQPTEEPALDDIVGGDNVPCEHSVL
jgi:hypothetical protein